MCLYIDDNDEFEHLSAGYRKARKEHTCGECRRTIEPGERYWFDTMVEVGYGIRTEKMCSHCQGVIDVGIALTGCHRSWWYGHVLDWLDENTGFVANIIRNHDLQSGATVRMLRYVALAKRHWKRHGQLVPIPESL
jgi:hypothetical protein